MIEPRGSAGTVRALWWWLPNSCAHICLLHRSSLRAGTVPCLLVSGYVENTKEKHDKWNIDRWVLWYSGLSPHLGYLWDILLECWCECSYFICQYLGFCFCFCFLLCNGYYHMIVACHVFAFPLAVLEYKIWYSPLYLVLQTVSHIQPVVSAHVKSKWGRGNNLPGSDPQNAHLVGHLSKGGILGTLAWLCPFSPSLKLTFCFLQDLHLFCSPFSTVPL